MSSGTSYIANICINQYNRILSAVIADRLIKAAIIALTLSGIINRTGFLIGTLSLTGVESIALALSCRKISCCDSNSTAAKCALAFFLTSAMLPLITLMGGMDYQRCAVALAGLNIALLSSWLISKGLKMKFEDTHLKKLRFCG